MPEGEPQITHENKKISGVRTRQKIEGGSVKLTEITFADYGTRRFCQRCYRLALKLIGKLAASHLVVGNEPR